LDWRTYAFGSAAFAALTTIFGKVGVNELNSDLATFIRTVVILVVSAALVWARGEWQRPDTLSSKGVVFLILSGAATGLSWLCYYRALQLAPASRVAPIDVAFLGEELTWKVAIGATLVAAGAIVMAI
jgi:transporter family protein